jgi:hypothetical protein
VTWQSAQEVDGLASSGRQVGRHAPRIDWHQRNQPSAKPSVRFAPCLGILDDMLVRNFEIDNVITKPKHASENGVV